MHQILKHMVSAVVETGQVSERDDLMLIIQCQVVEKAYLHIKPLEKNS